MPSLADRFHWGSHRTVAPSRGWGELTPCLRVPDLEYWLGPLRSINWEVIRSLAQHSGTPPLYQPQFQTQRLQEGPQGEDGLESGAPRLPAYPGDTPASCNPRPCGLAQLIFGPKRGFPPAGEVRVWNDRACLCSWSEQQWLSTRELEILVGVRSLPPSPLQSEVAFVWLSALPGWTSCPEVSP